MHHNMREKHLKLNIAAVLAAATVLLTCKRETHVAPRIIRANVERLTPTYGQACLTQGEHT